MKGKEGVKVIKTVSVKVFVMKRETVRDKVNQRGREGCRYRLVGGVEAAGEQRCLGSKNWR